ncbi:hypothetical protein E3E26_04225 [Thermococcus sp. LS1]|uniref:hypothetical protein n=1 Tax=Thermococcus sp. LS1 TaxID=1638259 RepID=UPI00143A7C85|nr:hypothetical protein [Thermococcus sp. LS1]NJD98993.1 hypothetical protein [Thermococcus sp. LS1]
MTLRPSWHRRAWWIGTAIGVFMVLYILTGRREFMLASATLFWSSLAIFMGRPVRIEERELVLEWGWPLVILRKHIPLDAIVEVLDPSSVGMVRLLKYFKEMIILSILWVFIGILGIVTDAPYGPYMWAMWIYWGILPLLMYLFPYSARKELTMSILLLTIPVAAYLYRTVEPSIGLYILMAGMVMAGMAYDGVLQQKGVILITEDDVYMLFAGSSGDVEKFLKQLAGVFNASAS